MSFNVSLYQALVLVAGGYATRLRIIVETDPGVLLVFLLLWGLALLSMAFFFASFFRRSRTASVVFYFYVIGQALVANFLIDPLVADRDIPEAYATVASVWPSFAMVPSLFLLQLRTPTHFHTQTQHAPPHTNALTRRAVPGFGLHGPRDWFQRPGDSVVDA
jgi:hypothetical protein